MGGAANPGILLGTQGFSLGCDPAAFQAAFVKRSCETDGAARAVVFSGKCRFPSIILINALSVIVITLTYRHRTVLLCGPLSGRSRPDVNLRPGPDV